MSIDDLPVIRDNIRKGFVDTQTKVNSWVQNLKKRWDGEDMDDAQSGRSYGEEPSYTRPRRSGDLGRRSGDRERYDADPQLLDDDFTTLELRDSEGKALAFLIRQSSCLNTDLDNSSAPAPPKATCQSRLRQDFVFLTRQTKGVLPGGSPDRDWQFPRCIRIG